VHDYQLSCKRIFADLADYLRGMTATLVLIRHGQSVWNVENLFTGWWDADLTDQGVAEARAGGRAMAEAGVLPDVVHTSMLRRAISTANIALDVADRHWLPVRRSWRLNERHYGALQGKDKKQTLEEFGEEQFMLWRRSFDVPPPPIEDDAEWSQAGLPQYAGLGDEMPRTECLKDVIARFLPYWESDITADLRAGKTVLVAAHGNSLRALVKHLDGISDADIAELNLPTGVPIRYELTDCPELRPVERTPVEERYLGDVEAAKAAAAAVAQQAG
jgi:2,3-bisphosphoglycerate-dependent phosphoglycerate mutase